MLDMRLRIPELMAARNLTTAYQLAKAAGGRMSMTNAYNLVESAGRMDVRLETVDILCDVFDVEPNDLIDREKKKPRR